MEAGKRVLLVLAGVLMLLLVACQSEDPTPAQAPTATPTLAPVATPTLAPTPTPLPQTGTAVDYPIECPKSGGHLVMGNAKEITNPTPFIASSVDHYVKASSMFEPLVALAKDGTIQGVLASSWQSNEDNSEWTFTLREGVKFHDGTEMTAADVVWSALYVTNPANAATGQADLAQVEDVVAVNDYTVRFELSGPAPLFLLQIESPSSLPVVKADSMEVGEVQVQVPPPGTGPFMFVEWVPADKLEVTKFADYWAGEPCVDGVTYKLISSGSARQNALRAGDVHIIERAGPEFAQRVESGEIDGIVASAATLSGFRMFNLNVANEPLDNITLREAVISGMDMQALLDEAFFGSGYLIDGQVPVDSAWHHVLLECCPHIPYDPDRARALAAEAGYDDEPLTLIVERGQGEPIGESLERSLRNAGFNIELVVLESGVYDERQANGDFHITPNSEGWGGDGFFGLQRWLCEPGLPEFSISNHGRLCMDEFDAIMEHQASVGDIEERLELYHDARKLVYDQMANKYMGKQYTRFFAWGEHVKGFDHIGNGAYQDYLGHGLPYIWLDE